MGKNYKAILPFNVAHHGAKATTWAPWWSCAACRALTYTICGCICFPIILYFSIRAAIVVNDFFAAEDF